MHTREIVDEEKNLKAIINKRLGGGYWFEYVEGIICLDHNPEFVKKLSSNGNYLLRKQCFNCGDVISNGMKHSLVKNVNNLPDINDDRKDIIWDFRKYVQNQLKRWLDEEIYSRYTEYLNSDIWKLKRTKVLERDNNICQACLTNKANEVHHLTYENLYDEPLFQLISVCSRCHEKIESKKQHKK